MEWQEYPKCQAKDIRGLNQNTETVLNVGQGKIRLLNMNQQVRQRCSYLI